MSGMTETSTATAIRPFTIPTISDADLEDLRERVTATRWPDPELSGTTHRACRWRSMQELARYWATDYDWRRLRRD